MTKSYIEHSSYPHQPGYLYDCAACEAECFCGNNTPPGNNPSCCGVAACLPGACHTECVHCALLREQLGHGCWHPVPTGREHESATDE